MFNMAAFALGLFLTIISLVSIFGVFWRATLNAINKNDVEVSYIQYAILLTIGLLLIKLFWHLAVLN